MTVDLFTATDSGIAKPGASPRSILTTILSALSADSFNSDDVNLIPLTPIQTAAQTPARHTLSRGQTIILVVEDDIVRQSAGFVATRGCCHL
jgi:hypothetical protein